MWDISKCVPDKLITCGKLQGEKDRKLMKCIDRILPRL